MSSSRQLAAIMFTDIVGYTALMGNDEQKAFKYLKKNRELQKPIIEQLKGRWIKELGDGVMASFNTVSDAVNAAIKIQEDCNAAKDFQLRIGIHLGEVVFENDDVFGDGVNIASRIQAIAKPGCIYVSESVYHNISNKKDIQTRFVKEEALKNVNQPVRIYEVITIDTRSAPTMEKKVPESSVEKNIAVLPFINLSNDPEQEYFSDGMSEELIVSLSRLKNVRVISRTTTMQYKRTAKDSKTIGKELSVGYLLEGSVRKFQDTIKITAELIDVNNDTNVWAETFRGKMNEVFDIQEEVAKKIVDGLMVTLSSSEKASLIKRPTSNPEAYDCYLRARNFLYRLTRTNLQFAVQLFQRAIDIDKNYALAYAGLAESYATLYSNFDRDDSLLEKAIESGMKALRYDSALPEAYAALGLAYFTKGIFNEAILAAQKAIEIDSNNFISYWVLGDIYHKMDQDEKALEMYQKVIELNPLFCPAYGHMRMMYERLGKRNEYNPILEKAIKNAFPQYLSLYPDDARGHLFFAIESAEAGYNEQAESELKKAIQLSSDDPFILYGVTCYYARKGAVRLAIDAFKKAIKGGYLHYEWIKRDPDLNNIRYEPEYVELMRGK